MGFSCKRRIFYGNHGKKVRDWSWEESCFSYGIIDKIFFKLIESMKFSFYSKTFNSRLIFYPKSMISFFCIDQSICGQFNIFSNNKNCWKQMQLNALVCLTKNQVSENLDEVRFFSSSMTKGIWRSRTLLFDRWQNKMELLLVQKSSRWPYGDSFRHVMGC